MAEINEKQVVFYVLGIFIVIFAGIILFSSSDYYNNSIYFEFKESEFKSTVNNKIDEHPIVNKINLKTGHQLTVERDIFDKLKIGDSVVKKVNSDSIIYYTDFGIIIEDKNEYKRNEYLKRKKND